MWIITDIVIIITILLFYKLIGAILLKDKEKLKEYLCYYFSFFILSIYSLDDVTLSEFIIISVINIIIMLVLYFSIKICKK